ncbi:MAG: Ltp family lipoprotein [Candidatus Moraniibacteriota bacterium]|nr:MAG: Ltp family lipoprotein [Candidatus Moranbacteria bacterium]
MSEQIQSLEQIQNVPTKRPWYKRWWVIVVAVFIIFGAIGGSGGDKSKTSSTSENSVEKQGSGNTVEETTAKTEEKKPSVPAEYKSALSQATSYANTMHMSKKGVYDQLVSEYGGKFSAEAAQYGIDNVETDWNANALAKAKTYQDSMHLSPAAIRDQLVSEHGEKFTQTEADYAITNLNK